MSIADEKKAIDKLTAGTKRVCVRVTNVTHLRLREMADAAGEKFGDWMLQKMVELAYGITDKEKRKLSSKK